ncbi:hypothetical protein DMN91_002108 [Ooceraea biroi]|uniref:Protein DPCD n=1 Tax=Ooceraea biroi TaxID=2015173 RepID=A0A026W9W2_OOCBI|nr:protein DPCD [Ooceraea biroi]EZA52753.1 Protein DPCD [Ooceraea biroi]RLU25945.1 hypothetical protein DMN91_002108 [Ooceraea biroi]
MTPDLWLNTLRNAEKTVFMQNGGRKAHFLLEDGREMVEEYNAETNVVIRRTWKTKNSFDTFTGWEVEVGTSVPKQNNLETTGIQESSTSPFITRRITKRSLEWRIRNLPYPKNVYSVTVEHDDTITVRTSNKKYYKKIRIPDLERIGLKPEGKNVSFMHQYNTLIITYKKPLELVDTENKILNMVLQQKAIETDLFK